MSARRMELKLSHQACVLPVSVFVVDGAFGHRGLALSTAVAAMVNFLIFYGMMSRHAGTLDTRRFLGTLIRCALAAGVLGLICWLGLSFGAMWLGSPLLIVRALSLLVLVGVAGLAYFAICLGLRVEEIQDVFKMKGLEVTPHLGEMDVFQGLSSSNPPDFLLSSFMQSFLAANPVHPC